MYSPVRVVKAIYWLLFGGSGQRRRVRHECARIAAGLFGDYPLSDDHQLWRSDRQFIKDFKRLSPGNYFSQDRKFMLREFVRFTANVPGVIAECGCYEGASAFFIAQEAPAVALHLFDSFEGLSAPTQEDAAGGQDVLEWTQGDMAATEKKLRNTLAGFDNVHIHKGWIPERFEDVANEQFRLVHIDVDLYQPTKDCLEFFYPRLSAGGVIVLDDYGSLMCPGAFRAAREFVADKPEYLILMTTGQGMLIKK